MHDDLVGMEIEVGVASDRFRQSGELREHHICDRAALRTDDVRVGAEVAVEAAAAVGKGNLAEFARVGKLVEIAVDRAEGQAGHLLAKLFKNHGGGRVIAAGLYGFEDALSLVGISHRSTHSASSSLKSLPYYVIWSRGNPFPFLTEPPPQEGDRPQGSAEGKVGPDRPARRNTVDITQGLEVVIS